MFILGIKITKNQAKLSYPNPTMLNDIIRDLKLL